MIPLRSGLSTLSSNSLKLQFNPPNSLYLLETGEYFGCLEERNAEILATLAAEGSIFFQSYANDSSRRSKIKSMKGKKVAQSDLQYLMNAIIYGPLDLSQSVGDYLSKCKMFLQDPVRCDRNVRYQNPHVLSRTEDIIMTSSLSGKDADVAVQDVVTVDAPQDLFSQLSDDGDLNMTDTPDALGTPLYK